MFRLLKDAWLPTAPVRGIIAHWSAGTHQFTALDRQHYHLGIEANGSIVRGHHSILDNCDPIRLQRGQYAAHTRARNSYRVGIALCGMAGARQTPFSAGRYPITPAQWEALAQAAADLVDHYQLTLTEKTLNSHFEQQRVWGPEYWQRGKWDISVLPWQPNISPSGVMGGFRTAVGLLLKDAPEPIRLLVDGNDLTGEADPFVREGVSWAWVRPLAEALDLSLAPERESVVLTPLCGTIPAQRLSMEVRGGRGFIRIPDLAEAFGWRRGWQDGTITITTGGTTVCARP